MANRVTLIQCTASKRDGTHEAKDLYDESDYFRKMREWARERDRPWYIMSAKHGLVHPLDMIEDYDERGLSVSQAEEISDTLADCGVSVVDITAGKDYTGPLIPELEKRGIDVIEHFRGEPIGRRKQLLKEATE